MEKNYQRNQGGASQQDENGSCENGLQAWPLIHTPIFDCFGGPKLG
jgi:hypothetical protein